MQVIFLYLIFLTTLSGGLPQSEGDTQLTADVKKLPSAEENHVPNDVDEILRELNEERAKNRDLNQTISDILERMADMERDIISNEEKITENQSSVVLLSKEVDDLQEDVASVQDDIVVVADDVESLTSSDQLQNSQIESLGTRGTWCGYQSGWTTVGTINYDSLTFSDSNMMEITGTPLDINTGNYSQIIQKVDKF